ncbi:MAG TPA: hypothetical protein DDW52_23730 [Planctomycetaceae bacterium]|nr:hypothetical protein [Planctomycetaceae bacterium]
MARGDNIFVNCRAGRIRFQHHGIDMGDGTVVHLVASDGGRLTIDNQDQSFCIRRDSIDDFAGGAEIHTKQHLGARRVDEIVQTAESMIGPARYNLIENNCEHFAVYCSTGRPSSEQIEMSEQVVSSALSMASKVAAAASSRIGAKWAFRSATKLHPAALLADGVEASALLVSCHLGASATSSRRLARTSGAVTAASVGAVLAGPAGAATLLAAHLSTTHAADAAAKLFSRGASKWLDRSRPA